MEDSDFVLTEAIEIEKFEWDQWKREGKIVVIRWSKENITHACGHQGPELFEISVFGSNDTYSNSRKEFQDKCSDCCIERIRKRVIQCVKCGEAIFVGRPVARYSRYECQTFNQYYQGVRVKSVGNFFLGCMRSDCYRSRYSGGRWTREGFVPQD